MARLSAGDFWRQRILRWRRAGWTAWQRDEFMNAVLSLGELPRVQVKTANIVERLKFDKKTRQGAVHFILPRDIGKVEIAGDIQEAWCERR